MFKNDKIKFFSDLAIEMGLLNLEDVKKYYYAVVRYLIRTTKHDGFCKAPDLGKFEIRVFSGVRRRNLSHLRHGVNATKDYSQPVRIMKLVPDYKIKKYINN